MEEYKETAEERMAQEMFGINNITFPLTYYRLGMYTTPVLLILKDFMNMELDYKGTKWVQYDVKKFIECLENQISEETFTKAVNKLHKLGIVQFGKDEEGTLFCTVNTKRLDEVVYKELNPDNHGTQNQ